MSLWCALELDIHINDEHLILKSSHTHTYTCTRKQTCFNREWLHSVNLNNTISSSMGFARCYFVPHTCGHTPTNIICGLHKANTKTHTRKLVRLCSHISEMLATRTFRGNVLSFRQKHTALRYVCLIQRLQGLYMFSHEFQTFLGSKYVYLRDS